MYYKSYQTMRNAAWRILLDCEIDRLPVDLNVICQKLGIRVLSYQESSHVIEQARLYHTVRRTNGLTFYLRDTPVILFDETLDLPQIMFTVAHELGHLILNHIEPDSAAPCRQGTEWKVPPQEVAANHFAARLLAPACVLWALNIHTAEEIMDLCLLPRPAAEYRARRMAALYQREKFLTDSLERALHQQFLPFISALTAKYPSRAT